MSLAADPAACTVPAAGGNSTHQLANSGAEKLVFKVKSSNNNEYRIKTVFGFVEPGASTPLKINRLAGPPKKTNWSSNSDLPQPMPLTPQLPSTQLPPPQLGKSLCHSRPPHRKIKQ